MENWPYPIKIYTLGRFEILINDKPLEMLKAIIAFGGRDVSEEQLTDALWPEADGDLAHQTFKTTLHRLRNLIGNEEAIWIKEGKVTLDSRYCWVDVRAFEDILKQAALSPNGIFEKALAIYRGHFLHRDNEQPWLISKREALKNRFLDIINKLGKYYEEAQEFDKAAECYQKGLGIDDLVEEFYRHLMTCLSRLGKKSEAIRVYRQCKDILYAELDIEPSPKTNTIYKSLK